MQEEFNKYGRRLTEREYLEAVAALYPQTEEELKRSSEAERRKKETGLMIDHRLGVEYPQDKRAVLHAARERATKRFMRSPATLLKSAFVRAAQKLKIIRGVPDIDEGSLSLMTRVLAEEFTREKSLPTEDIVRFAGKETEPLVRKLRGQGP